MILTNKNEFIVYYILFFYKWKGRLFWLFNIEIVGVYLRKIEKGRDEERYGERKERERINYIVVIWGRLY